jgi:hypothetical protein
MSLALFILICLFAIVNVTYGDYFIEKFKLESKYPKISALIKFRNEFKHIIFFFNVFLIVLALSYSIYINMSILSYFN